MLAESIFSSKILWAGTLIAGIGIFFQTFVIMKKTIDLVKEMGIENKAIKKAISASAITAIGPSLTGAIASIPLVLAIGAPVALLRVSIVGSPGMELVMAETGMNVMDVTSATMNIDQFVSMLWAIMLAMACHWPFMMILIKPVEKARDKLANTGGENKKSFATLLSISAILGALFPVNISYISSDTKTIMIWIAGFIFLGFVEYFGKKKNLGTLRSLGLPIAGILGFVLAIIL